MTRAFGDFRSRRSPISRCKSVGKEEIFRTHVVAVYTILTNDPAQINKLKSRKRRTFYGRDLGSPPPGNVSGLTDASRVGDMGI